MNRHCGGIDCKSQTKFRLRFERGLIEHLFRGGTVAEGFGIVWEKTLEEIPLEDEAQGELYRHLLAWAKSDGLFTARRDAAQLVGAL